MNTAKNEKFNRPSLEEASEILLRNERTLLGKERLLNAGYCVQDVVKRKIEGQIVECGTFRGGALAFMSLANEISLGKKYLWGFDTFKGLPAPSNLDGHYSKGRGFEGDLLATEEDCRKTFELLNLDMTNVNLVPGLFQDTLHITKDKIDKISVLRLDGDWYDSTKCCLEQLYDHVSVGGWIIIDDYGHWEGCKKAVDEFLKLKDINPNLKQTDYTEVCWIKEK